MILDSPSKSVEVLLDGAVASAHLPVTASWGDLTTTNLVLGSADTQTNNLTAVTAVPAPPSGQQRQIRNITVYNADTANAVVTVRLNNGGTFRTLIKETLTPGKNLVYDWGAGWQIQAGGSGLFVRISGDTMTGLLTLSGDPGLVLHAVTKQYADALITAHLAAGNPHPQYLTDAEGDALFLTPAEGNAAYVLKAGDTMAGALAIHDVVTGIAANLGSLLVAHDLGASSKDVARFFAKNVLFDANVLTAGTQRAGSTGFFLLSLRSAMAADGSGGTSVFSVRGDGAASLFGPDLIIQSTTAAMLRLASTAVDGDQYVSFFMPGVQEWAIGVDDSDGDKFKIAPSGALDSSTVLTLTTGGLIGVGTPAPSRAILELNGAVGLTSAIFGGDGLGIGLVRSDPIVGLNAYYNAGWKAIGTGGAVLLAGDNAGNLQIFTAPLATADAALTMTSRLLMRQSGKIGIGGDPFSEAFFTVFQPGSNFGDGLRLISGANKWELVAATDFYIGLNAATVLHVTPAGALLAKAGTISLPGYSFDADPDTGVYLPAVDILGLVIGGADGMRVTAPADGNTAISVRRNVGGAFSLQQVSMGVTDSGGTGFKLLRVPN